MSLFSNGIETKEFTNPVYEGLAKTRGHTRSRTNVRYRSIALDGYKRNGIVFACLEEIIKACLQIGLVIGVPGEDGEDKPVKNHKMNAILEQPNQMYGISEFKHRAILFYYISGQAPIHVMKTLLGNMYTYRPDEVQYESRGSDMIPYSDVYYTAGRWLNIPSEEFTLWKRYDPLDFLDGLGNGMSMLEPILKEIDQRNAMKEWNISLLEEGARMSGILSVKNDMSDASYNRLDRKLKEKHRGKKNVGGIMLLDGDATFTETSINPKDMDWIEGEKETIKQICSGMGVDPILVGYNEYSSYNNKKEANKELYTRKAIPLMQSLADVLTNIFRRLNMISTGQKVCLVTKHIHVLQQDMGELAKRMKESPYSLNEKRLEMGKEEVRGGDLIVDDKVIIDTKTGETYIPMNMVKMGVEDKPIPKDNRDLNKKDFQY